jgi:hypothetical protein
MERALPSGSLLVEAEKGMDVHGKVVGSILIYSCVHDNACIEKGYPHNQVSDT